MYYIVSVWEIWFFYSNKVCSDLYNQKCLETTHIRGYDILLVLTPKSKLCNILRNIPRYTEFESFSFLKNYSTLHVSIILALNTLEVFTAWSALMNKWLTSNYSFSILYKISHSVYGFINFYYIMCVYYKI